MINSLVLSKRLLLLSDVSSKLGGLKILVIRTKKVESCFGGNNVYDFLLNTKINEDFIVYIGKSGKLNYYNNFEKPYFNLIVKGKYTIKGTSGKDTIRCFLPPGNPEDYLNEITLYINSYNPELPVI